MCHQEVLAMRKFMANMATAKQILWECVELGFVTILAIMLIYLILGQGSGVFVLSVAENVTKFANGVPTQSLIGLALLLGVIYLIMNRVNRTR
jgi:hypothetical protein